MEQIRLFISYAHKNEAFFKDFTARLKEVTQSTEHFNWTIWDDRDIHVGTIWDDTIQKNIQNCNVTSLII